MDNIVFAGSFDPITNGHLWVIKEALNISKKVTVFIAENPAKKSFFTKQQKAKLIFDTCVENGIEDRVSVHIIQNQFIAQASIDFGAEYMIRGIRSGIDFDYESVLQHANTDLIRGAKTLFVMPPRDLESVSSSFVKSLIGPVGWHMYVKKLVPLSVYNEIIKEYLIGQFKKHGLDETYHQMIDYCLFNYDLPGRYYHNVEHIIQCVSELDKLVTEFPYRILPLDVQNLLLAILFHDVVYGQKSPQSDEELSAEKLSGFIVNKPHHNKAVEYILLTQHLSQKRKENLTEAEKIMISIDLSILGQNPDLYNEYAQNIRKEYSYAPDIDYAKGRISALNTILANPPIFPSTCFSKYEARAHSNIKNEIQILQKGI